MPRPAFPRGGYGMASLDEAKGRVKEAAGDLADDKT
jgi:hypothetical protein